MTIITNGSIGQTSTSRPRIAGVDYTVSTGHGWSIVFPASVLMVNRPRTFADERTAFRESLPRLLSEYAGEWVAVSGGQVIEHHRDRKVVTRRFFEGRTRGPVYIGFVGRQPPARQASPFRAQRRA
jgi:hypothetical protein